MNENFNKNDQINDLINLILKNHHITDSKKKRKIDILSPKENVDKPIIEP